MVKKERVYMKKAAFHNLGCKVNAYETQAMEHLLKEAGYEIVSFEEQADVYIINTCTVTNIADRKSRQMLHKARKQNPDAIVVAAGCYVQTSLEQAKKDLAIDIIIGNNCKSNILEILNDFQEKKERQDRWIDIGKTKEYESMELGVIREHTRVYLKVQDGCNQFCTYCIIPYARGRIRSLQKEQAVSQVKKLAKEGYREIVLTGIHLSSYGKDLEERENLLTLTKAIHEVEGIERIRYGSLEPRIITEEFVREIASLDKICPHFHLSLQSGCAATLKRMNRHYTPEEYLDKCRLLRKYFRNPAITTDVIVGFPGETEEEFEETKAFLDQVDFYETHIFKYSKRQGTKAAAMKDQISNPVKSQRSEQLIKRGKDRKDVYRSQFIGTSVPVLWEEKIEADGKDYWVGYSKEYVKMALESREDLRNRVTECLVTGPMNADFILCRNE